MARHFPKSAHSSGLDLFALLKKRRSIRAYRPDPVPPEKIEAIISAGRHAPSGAHRHPWHIRIVTDKAVKKVLREKCEIADTEWHKNADKKIRQWLNSKHITPEKHFLTDAPVLIVIFGDTNAPYWLESVWICIGYMMLAAVDQGLGTVTYTPGNKSFMNEILNVPKHFDPQVILPIGYPLIEPQNSPKKQTGMEYRILCDKKHVVSENKPSISRSEKAQLHHNGPRPESRASKETCACGCGKLLISLNPRRKFIQGHARFGVNGLHKVLKSPPKCQCGCGLPTQWNWEKMVWKKYIDNHIGIRNTQSRKSTRKYKQFDMFKK